MLSDIRNFHLGHLHFSTELCSKPLFSIAQTSGSEASEMGDNNNTTLCSLALMSVGMAVDVVVVGKRQKGANAKQDLRCSG